MLIWLCAILFIALAIVSLLYAFRVHNIENMEDVEKCQKLQGWGKCKNGIKTSKCVECCKGQPGCLLRCKDPC
jgi:hypothetical protein